MRFKLQLVANFYKAGEIEKYKTLGFKFKPESWGTYDYVIDDPEGVYIDIETIEELMDFVKKYGQIVVDIDFLDNDTKTIEIYNGYRE